MVSTKQKIFDHMGSAVDSLFLTAPKIAAPFKPKRKINRADYEKQLNFYIDNGYTQTPERFFQFPPSPPAYTVESKAPYHGGTCRHISFPSAYEVKNPLIKDHYRSFSANQTGYLVYWTHNDGNRKTVLCLHGYMLGEPKQAERMFGVKKLFDAGLDVALFITPFHWRRAPQQKSRRGIFLQPDNVPMTCECFGQAMCDLESTLLILKNLGAHDIGLIGASLGGYNAALYVALSGQVSFAAMIVPAVSLAGPLGLESAWLPFAVNSALLQKIRTVWELHSPLHMRPRLSADNMLVVASRGDRLCPFESVKMLCDCWNITNYQFLTGGHWLIFNNKSRGKAWYGFLTQQGFL